MTSVNAVTQASAKLIWKKKKKKVQVHTSSVKYTSPQTKILWTTVTILWKLSRIITFYVLYNIEILSAFYEVSDSQSTQNQHIIEVKRIKYDGNV